MASLDPTLLIAAFATLFFFCLFSIALGGSRKKNHDMETRIKELAAEIPNVIPGEAEGKKSKRLANKRIKSDKWRKRTRQIEDELYNVGIEMPVLTFLVYWVGSIVLLILAMVVAGANLLISILVTFAVALLPSVLVLTRRNKRRNIIESQLLDCIQVLSNALKAGHSFSQAMGNIASEMDGPIAEEFNRVFLETQHGMSLDDSLEAMCARVGSDDLSMMCTAIEIQRQVGGNLAQILLNISGTIKSRLRLKADIKVKSASGRISGLIIGALPILLFVLFMVINPGYMTFFLETKLGYICIGICLALEAMGFVVINNIITIKY